MTPTKSLVLGWKPHAHGFAWIAFESPFSIYDWGHVETRGEKNARCLTQLERLLGRLHPELMVVEAFEGAAARQSPRIKRLCKSAVSLARDRDIEVGWLTREDVRAGFAPVGARLRHEIASAIARTFDILREQLPPKRKIWEAPNRKMALFDAAALVIAHYHLGASSLFDDLTKSVENDDN